MNPLKFPAFAKLLVKLMLAASITVAAAAFISGPSNSNAAVVMDARALSFGSVSVSVSAFQPDQLAQSSFNDIN